MFEKRVRHCPRCGYEIRDKLTEGEAFVCSVCRSRFRIMLDSTSGKAAFYEESSGEIPEPLYLPKGSIRALTALATCVGCWVLMVMGRDVPGSLLGLVLTVLGYYFGFRVRVKASGSRMYDPSAVRTQPLNLPGGAIRKLLILGFVVAGGALIIRKRIAELRYLEFFMIVAGMIIGYVFARVFTVARVGRVMVAVSHLKGLAVLAAAGCLGYLFISGGYADYPPLTISGLCAVVSFYYGSRA